MTRRARAWLASVLLAAVPAAAQELPDAGGEPFVVPTGPAPTIDGRIDEAEWKGAADFTIARGDSVCGSGSLLRTGRQLSFAYDSRLPAWGIGLRLYFTDPVAGRTNLVLIAPLDPPRPPLVGFRTLTGRDPERIDVTAADIRFTFPDEGEKSFRCEARLPLDVLEIAATERDYRFSIEVWDLRQGRPIAAYPQDGRAATVLSRPAVFRSEGAWGADAAHEKPPPPSPALVLLEEVGKETDDGPYFPFVAGWVDGQRSDAPLAKLEARAEEIVAGCPDMIPVRTFLVQVRLARNDLAGALKAHLDLGAYLPPLARTAHYQLLRAQMLRDLGRFDDALAVFTEHAKELEEDPTANGERAAIEALREGWRVEQTIRREEAARDDLPRVRLETTKGVIDVELYEDDAPNAVANFLSLVESGFYDGTRFHWVRGGDRVVGGDPNSKDDDPHNDGYGDPGYLIESEPGRRQTFAMTLGMVDKRRERRTEGSAFAIYLAPCPPVDGVNTVFGRVLEGEDVVRKLEHYDAIRKATVLRKRPHPNTPLKR
jgi:peptidyl-prolyl cis-trans isomerase B (cyclophilin B)